MTVLTCNTGEGVNLALEDSMKLSEAILKAASSPSSSLDNEVYSFEQDMFIRAKVMQQMTWDMLEAMFLTANAPRSSIERYIITAVAGEFGPTLTTLITPVVYAWFFVFKLIW